jgi:transposase
VPGPRKYPEELRERAIQLAMDAREDPASRPGAVGRVGGQLGINTDTLRGWVAQAEIDAGRRAGTSTTDAERLAEVKREVKELRRANAICARRRLFAAELDRPAC